MGLKQSPGSVLQKVFLKISQNSRKNTCARISFVIKLQAESCNFIKRETLTQVFSCEYCEIFKNTFVYRTRPLAAFARKISKLLNFPTFNILALQIHNYNYKFTTISYLPVGQTSGSMFWVQKA